ncbi:MAG: metallophosphoesterase [Acidilobaceae archaeon]|nr:metallophosphoesterase [Acidilobaceae archaeon]MDW7973791.1 metallophosphoesterase [Sulfolobales archaeon]
MIYALSDVHGTRFLPELRGALAEIKETPCVLLLAGDLLDRGKVESLLPVLAELERVGSPLVATFGNEEYHEVRQRLRAEFSSIKWLEDELYSLRCEGREITILGTPGSLDRLTPWQRKNMPWLEGEFRERERRLRSLLQRAGGEAIFMSHYVIARENLRGEDERIWPEMFSSSIEALVAELRPKVAVHGHAHKGSPIAYLNGVPVYNVALPLRKRVVKLDL